MIVSKWTNLAFIIIAIASVVSVAKGRSSWITLIQIPLLYYIVYDTVKTIKNRRK